MSVFDFVKNKAEIFDVVSRWVKLRRVGAYWKGTCPFHSETDASFTISPERKIFYCFGCHEGGDVVSFVAKIENLSQLEAALKIANEFGINIPRELLDPGKDRCFKDKDSWELAKKACSVFADWANRQLALNAEALRYLESRSVNNFSIDSFGIGFFPVPEQSSLKRLISFAYDHGVLVHDLVRAGILIEQGKNIWSPFVGRIIFPIRGYDGKVVGFGGRVIDPNDTRPKYYNTKDSDIFHKGSILFGMDLAKHAAVKSRRGFLVEGYMDCIAMFQRGFTETFAVLGTACTAQHIRLLSRFLDTLYVVYDSDRAGRDAMLRLAKSCWDVEIDLKVVILPPGYDPASFLQDNGDLSVLVDNALDIFDFFVKSMEEKLVGASLPKKLDLLRELLITISGLNDFVKRDLLLLEVARVFQIPLSSIRKGVNFVTRGSSYTSSRGKKFQLADFKKVEKSGYQHYTDNEVDSDLDKLSSQLLFMHICAYKLGLEGFQISDDIKVCFSGRVKEVFELWRRKIETGLDSVESFIENLDDSYKSWIKTGLFVSEQGLDKLQFKRLGQNLKVRYLRKTVAGVRREVIQMESGENKSVSDALKKISFLSKKVRFEG